MKNYILIIGFLFFIACKENTIKLKTLQGNAIGTVYSIKYISPNNANFELKIDSLINIVNNSTSTYIPSSDISKINQGDTTIVVDAIFEEVFKKSEKIYNETRLALGMLSDNLNKGNAAIAQLQYFEDTKNKFFIEPKD